MLSFHFADGSLQAQPGLLLIIDNTMHIPHIIGRFNRISLFYKFDYGQVLGVIHFAHLSAPILLTEFKQPLTYDINLI